MRAILPCILAVLFLAGPAMGAEKDMTAPAAGTMRLSKTADDFPKQAKYTVTAEAYNASVVATSDNYYGNPGPGETVRTRAFQGQVAK